MTKRKKKNSYTPAKVLASPAPYSTRGFADVFSAPRILVHPNQLTWIQEGFAEADRQSQEWETYRAEQHRLDRVYGPQLGPERAPWAPPTKEELWAEKLRLEALIDEEYATNTAWGSGTSDDLYEVHKDLLEYYRTYPGGTTDDGDE